MAGERFKIEGLKELDEALKELPRATGKNVLRRALIQAGLPIQNLAFARAPRKTGRLQTSLTTGTKLSRRQRSLHRPVSSMEVFVGPAALVQAITEEFGTAYHPPKPFFRPAWDEGKDKSMRSIRDNLAHEIEKARARMARKAARIIAKAKT